MHINYSLASTTFLYIIFLGIRNMKDEQNEQAVQIGLEKSHSISHVWKKLKSSIFDVLFVLLDNSDEEESMFGLCFETGVDYLQMMSFPFNSAVIEAWNAGETLDGITNIFNKINISTYIPGVGFNTFLILMYSLILLIILVILDIVYVAYSFSKKKFKFTWPLVLLAKIVPLIVTVMFLPIMETLLQVVNCTTVDNESYQVLVTFPNVKCWEGWHLFHSGITLLFSFFFVFISCIVTLALFEPRMTTNRLTARQNSTGQVVFIINKIICQFIFSFSPFEGSLPYCLMLFVLSGWLYSTYNISQPYYDKKASKFFRILSTYYFWTNLMLLISQFLKPAGFKDGLVIWTCGIIFIGITIVFQRKSNIDTLFSSNLKFKSGAELESHLQYVLQLHHNRNEDRNSYMLLLGYIEKHIEICLEEDCPLRAHKNRQMSGKQEEELSCKQLLKQLERMFHYGIKKYPKCTKLQITFAFFYMEKLSNKVRAYEHFTSALLQTQPSFGEQFIIYRFRKIILEKLEETQEDEQTDLIELIRFDNHISLCEEGMQSSGKLHKEFWIQLFEQSPDLRRLNLIGARITETNNVIKQNYKEIIKISNDGLSIIEVQYNYALYQIFIIQDIKEGKQLLEEVKQKHMKRKKMESVKKGQRNVFDILLSRSNEPMELDELENLEEQILNNEKRMMMIVDINSSNGFCCRIQKVNAKFLEFTKFQEKSLVNEKLSKILPSVYKGEHDALVNEWLVGENKLKNSDEEKESSKNQASYLKKRHIGYIKESSGFIRKVNYIVHFLHLDSKFIVEMGIEKSSESVIICDNEGIITEYCYLSLLRFPSLRSTIDIESILSVDIVESLKENSSFSIPLTIQTEDAIVEEEYECKVKKVSILFKSPPERDHISEKKCYKDLETIEQLYANGNLLFRKNIGMIVTIAEKTNTEDNHFQNQGLTYQFTKKKSMLVRSQTIKFELSENTESIEPFNEIKLKIEECYDFKKGSERRKFFVLQSNIFNDVNYSQYKDAEGNQCLIKAYRYHGGVIKRIYYDNLLEEQSDYDYEQKLTDLQAKLNKQKIADQKYRHKVKNAINTHINHPEIVSLFYFAIFFFLLFIAAHILVYSQFQTHVIDNGIATISQSKANVRDLFTISRNLLEALFQQKIEAKELEKYMITFYPLDDSSMKIDDFLLEDGTTESMTITNALIRAQANLLKYSVKSQMHSANIELVSSLLGSTYFNYLEQILPIIETDLSESPSLKNKNALAVMLMVTVATGLMSIVFVVFWIIQVLKMKSKILGILIWFLDIPFEYLNYAYRQCSYFNKNYVESRKIIEKNISVDECEHYIEEYKYESLNHNSDEDQHDGQKKIREILISRYHKKGIFQKFSFKQLHKLWLLIFFNAFLFAILILQSWISYEVDFITTAVSLHAREIIWVQTIPMLALIQQQKSSYGSPIWKYFKEQQLPIMSASILNKIQQENDNSVEASMMVKIVEEIISKNDSMTAGYMKFTSTNLCLNGNQVTRCQAIISSRLIGGYSVFIEYVKNLPTQIEKQELFELYEAITYTVAPAISQMMDEWNENFLQKILKISKMISIGIWVYLTLFVLAFLTVWCVYLRSMNINLNESIQILNLIPIFLIPVARKQIRQFLRWIILVSSQQGTEKTNDT